MAARSVERTKFVADAMLGSLARKLRAFGFDTAYFKEGEDSELLSLAKSEGRVILTSDRALAHRGNHGGLVTLLVAGKNDSQRLSSVKEGALSRRLSIAHGEPRCSVCNGTLEPKSKSEVEGRVPPSVQKRHRRFYRCTTCGRVYWRGAHWKKLRWLQGRLGSKPVGSLTR
jgi:uncharacterized protein with PIN domain